MVDDPRLLVVDDEEPICEGCRRIFSRQGFQVEKTSNALAGLNLAAEGDYAAILLDIKMPGMSGIEFLEALRVKKPNVPVILMTGYPSVPNAMSAIRLGAAGYVTKPFTPEEISQAVHKFVRCPAGAASGRSAGQAKPETWSPAAEGFAFWNEAWLQPGDDGSVRAGVMLPRTQAAQVESVRLPGVGEAVFQGLPLAGLKLADGGVVTVPAPISGVVVAANEELAAHPAALAADPCSAGWIAAVCPTRFEEETKNCAARRVILFNAAASAQLQQAKLAGLGCHVRTAARWEDLASPLQDDRFPVLILDADTAGPDGPALVARIRAGAPALKIVVVASPGCGREAAYRARGIFYYAVEPFADLEIADILEAAFRPPRNAPRKDRPKPPPGEIATINVVNRNGTRLRLLAPAGLLRRERGLGFVLRQKLLDRLFPIETILGETKINAPEIMQAAGVCDRVVVLLAKDIGRLPGSLVRDTKSEFISVSGEGGGNVTTLVIQPLWPEDGVAGFDGRSTEALAEHIVNDLASY
jgi:DNA-binding response OmpR family regulator/glycine cleavage system H lipoate-binding protein